MPVMSGMSELNKCRIWSKRDLFSFATPAGRGVFRVLTLGWISGLVGRFNHGGILVVITVVMRRYYNNRPVSIYLVLTQLTPNKQ